MRHNYQVIKGFPKTDRAIQHYELYHFYFVFDHWSCRLAHFTEYWACF